MLTFSKPVRLKDFFYADLMRYSTSVAGVMLGIIIVALGAVNIGFFFLFHEWFSLVAGLGVLLLFFVFNPYLRYMRTVKMAGAKEIVYTINDDGVSVESGATKSTISKEMVKSVRIYKRFLKFNLNHTVAKLYMFFEPADRKKIIGWLEKSAYKDFISK